VGKDILLYAAKMFYNKRKTCCTYVWTEHWPPSTGHTLPKGGGRPGGGGRLEQGSEPVDIGTCCEEASERTAGVAESGESEFQS
jgi:hypothetical protein